MNRKYVERNAALMAKYGASTLLMHKLTAMSIDECEAVVLKCKDRRFPVSELNLPDLEQAVAFAIERAHSMHEESWVMTRPNTSCGPRGEYTLDDELCWVIACEQQALPPHLWYVLHLANHWSNDLAEWATSVLKDTVDQEVNDPVIRAVPYDEEADCAQSDEQHAPFDTAAEELVRSVVADRNGIPLHIYEGLVAYRDRHAPPGGFIHAVLTNNFSEVVSRADDMSLPALGDILHWVHENMPAASYGSPKLVEKWLAGDGKTRGDS